MDINVCDNKNIIYTGKCEHCGQENTFPSIENLVPKFCKNCGKEINYSLSKYPASLKDDSEPQ